MACFTMSGSGCSKPDDGSRSGGVTGVETPLGLLEDGYEDHRQLYDADVKTTEGGVPDHHRHLACSWRTPIGRVRSYSGRYRSQR